MNSNYNKRYNSINRFLKSEVKKFRKVSNFNSDSNNNISLNYHNHDMVNEISNTSIISHNNSNSDDLISDISSNSNYNMISDSTRITQILPIIMVIIVIVLNKICQIYY